MVPARFKKICVDAVDPLLLGMFWAPTLHQRWTPDNHGEGGLVRPDGRHSIWFNRVPQPKRGKHRVHLDIYTEDVVGLEALGAIVVLAEGDDRHWTVLADPEGGEFCAFVRDAVPAERLHGLVVDSVDPGSQARWWADVLGARVLDDPRGFSTAEAIPGLAHLTMDFVPVPEPKVEPNRVHCDVAVDDVAELLERGANVLRTPGGDIGWYVLADPEGNEFCAFVEPSIGKRGADWAA